ncbi:MAG: hypothetical protein GEV28_04710 [Actinophytocola sp.]|uniref:tripartite tricarboxylate transporter TctB family protein n=1 Tax=Actinophytocola sp. TaxID=1872138 RepID=UPI00132CA132|nr:tripartite tricarboxylate transporter TctB family protein [Actinophytocola sp.]MPZ79721.1 hypothetical protein [Actinophytocola sp.]
MNPDPQPGEPDARTDEDGGEQRHSYGHLIVPMLLTAAGTFLIVESVHSLPYRTTEGQPGPGFLPIWLGGVLIGISGLIVFQDRRSLRGDTASPAANPARWKIVKFLAVMAAGILAIQFAGALVGIALLIVAELWWVEDQPFWRSVAVAVLISAATYALFEVALDVQLP